MISWDHEASTIDPSRRTPQTAKDSLRQSRYGHERDCPQADCGLRREGRKEVEEITRKERDRKLREQQPIPDQAFLMGGTHGYAHFIRAFFSTP
jgi:hypothetical protein